MHRIMGKEGLVKDPHTGTISNTNVSEYENYKRSKRKNRELFRVVAKLEERVTTLESTIRQLTETNKQI